MRSDEGSERGPEIGPEVPEADALEQARSVPPEDDARR